MSVDGNIREGDFLAVSKPSACGIDASKRVRLASYAEASPNAFDG